MRPFSRIQQKYILHGLEYQTYNQFGKALEKQDSPIFDVPWSLSMKYDKSQYTMV